jgi:ABC-type multidrug transport system ATPase subunit
MDACGAGKTTTTPVLATLVAPDADWASVLGHDVGRAARAAVTGCRVAGWGQQQGKVPL